MRIAVISDIHEDIVSLRLAMHKIERLNVDIIACIGDISGFSVPFYPYRETRNAHECLAIIKANCQIILLGNHDLHIARKIPELSPEFEYPLNWYELDYFEKKELSKDKLWLYEEDELAPYYTKDDINFIRRLPEIEILKTDTVNILFTHYAYPNLSGSLKDFYVLHKRFYKHFNFMESKNCEIGFIGHSHNESGIYATRSKLFSFGFKKTIIKELPACVMTPAIANNQIRNGFCIFDTADLLLTAVKV